MSLSWSNSDDVTARPPLMIAFRFEGYPGSQQPVGQEVVYLPRKQAAQAKWSDTFQGCSMTLNAIDKASPHQRMKLYLTAVERYIEYIHEQFYECDNVAIRPITSCLDLTTEGQKGVVATLHREIEQTLQSVGEAKLENQRLRRKLGMLS